MEGTNRCSNGMHVAPSAGPVKTALSACLPLEPPGALPSLPSSHNHVAHPTSSRPGIMAWLRITGLSRLGLQSSQYSRASMLTCAGHGQAVHGSARRHALFGTCTVSACFGRGCLLFGDWLKVGKEGAQQGLTAGGR